MVAISPQLSEHSAKIAKRHKLEFDVLSDPGNETAKAWGLVFTFEEELRRVYKEGFKIDLERFNGDASWALPVPGRFVIATDGKVVSVDVDPDYTQRPEPEKTISVLAALV